MALKVEIVKRGRDGAMLSRPLYLHGAYDCGDVGVGRILLMRDWTTHPGAWETGSPSSILPLLDGGEGGTVSLDGDNLLRMFSVNRCFDCGASLPARLQVTEGNMVADIPVCIRYAPVVGEFAQASFIEGRYNDIAASNDKAIAWLNFLNEKAIARHDNLADGVSKVEGRIEVDLEREMDGRDATSLRYLANNDETLFYSSFNPVLIRYGDILYAKFRGVYYTVTFEPPDYIRIDYGGAVAPEWSEAIRSIVESSARVTDGTSYSARKILTSPAVDTMCYRPGWLLGFEMGDDAKEEYDRWRLWQTAYYAPLLSHIDDEDIHNYPHGDHKDMLDSLANVKSIFDKLGSEVRSTDSESSRVAWLNEWSKNIYYVPEGGTEAESGAGEYFALRDEAIGITALYTDLIYTFGNIIGEAYTPKTESGRNLYATHYSHIDAHNNIVGGMGDIALANETLAEYNKILSPYLSDRLDIPNGYTFASYVSYLRHETYYYAYVDEEYFSVSDIEGVIDIALLYWLYYDIDTEARDFLENVGMRGGVAEADAESCINTAKSYNNEANDRLNEAETLYNAADETLTALKQRLGI